MIVLAVTFVVIIALMPWALVDYLRTRRRMYGGLAAFLALAGFNLFLGVILFDPNMRGGVPKGPVLVRTVFDPYFVVLASGLATGVAVVFRLYQDGRRQAR